MGVKIIWREVLDWPEGRAVWRAEAHSHVCTLTDYGDVWQGQFWYRSGPCLSLRGTTVEFDSIVDAKKWGEQKFAQEVPQ